MRFILRTYWLPIAIFCVLCLFIGTGLLWYLDTVLYPGAMESILVELARLVMDDEEFLELQKYRLLSAADDIRIIDAALGHSDNSASAKYMRENFGHNTTKEERLNDPEYVRLVYAEAMQGE